MENMLLITMVKYKVKLLRIAKSPHNYLYIENQNENEWEGVEVSLFLAS
jgi:hypothetical protein